MRIQKGESDFDFLTKLAKENGWEMSIDHSAEPRGHVLRFNFVIQDYAPSVTLDWGASLLDFTNSGPVVGPAVVKAVKLPVIGGFGGGPWLDGRMRMGHAAIGYGAQWLDSKLENYANVAKITLDALTNLVDDVRNGRQIKGMPK